MCPPLYCYNTRCAQSRWLNVLKFFPLCRVKIKRLADFKHKVERLTIAHRKVAVFVVYKVGNTLIASDSINCITRTPSVFLSAESGLGHDQLEYQY